MRNLRLNDSLANALAAALLRIARTDGTVTNSEIDSVRGLLADGVVVDDEDLFFSDVGPGELRQAIDAAIRGNAPHRSSLSDRAEIVTAFLEAARRIALADGVETAEETGFIAEFARVLGQASAAKA